VTLAVDTALVIGLEVHGPPACTKFAWPLLKQLEDGYNECAVLDLNGIDEWRREHRTARKRADRAERRGYQFVTVERHARADEIQATNLSAPARQGRPMSAGYRQPVSTEPLPDYPCPRHGVHTYGVEDANGVLVAYSWIYRAGDLALVSQILGHADHLKNEVMYLLIAGIVDAESPHGGYLVYNRYDSGGDGLRFFKDRCGFEPQKVHWSQW
jgi:hypothetical protein